MTMVKDLVQTKLRRTIRLPHAVAMVVGTIIGASIFVQPSEITALVPSIPMIFLVWLISGVLTFIGALVCAELSSIFTSSGGVYVYLKEAFSPLVGFLWGWAMLWSMHSGIIGAIAVIFSRYTAYFIPMGEWGIKLVAVAVIWIISGVNYLGVRQGSAMQTLFTLGKLIAVAAIILLGFMLGSGVGDHFVSGELAKSTLSLRDFLLAMVAGLFAFGGWHMVTYNAEETINPRRTIPRALMLGTFIVTLSYILMNAVYMYILPLDKVAASKRIAADAADVLLGSGGGAIMSAVVIFSTFGALSGIILAGPRVYFSMARDGLLFSWAGKIHPRYRTPHRAILIQAAWASVLVLSGTFKLLFTRVVYTEWIFFGLMTIGLLKLRQRKGIRRGFKIWAYPALPVLFILSSFAIVLNQIVSDLSESLIGLFLVVSGIPVYLLWVKRKKTRS